MQDIILTIYPWIKSLHIIAVISWMAGIFYLPRLFVHHVEQVKPGSDTDLLFQMMERKLLRVIMTPAMIVTWVCGLVMLAVPGIFDWGSAWSWLKILSVISMTVFHFWLARCRIDLVDGTNQRSGRQYRFMNEIPTVLLIVIVIMVVVRPF